MADQADQEVVLRFTSEIEDFLSGLATATKEFQQSFGQMQDAADQGFDHIKAGATETADHVSKEGERAGRGFMGGLTLVLAAAGGALLASLHGVLERFGEQAEALSTLSLATGDSAGKLQQFQYALSQTGVSSQSLQYMLTMLQSRIAMLGRASNESKGPLHELGLNAKDMVGKDTISQLELISDRIKRLNNTAQVDISRQLFGRAGASLLPFLEEGKVGIERLMAAFKPIPDDVLESFRKFSEAGEALHQTWTAFSAELLKPVVDMLTRMEETITDLINKFRSLSQDTKLTILVAAISAAAVATEVLVSTLGSFFVQSVAVRSFVVLLESFAPVLRGIAAVVIIVAAAWKSNFANIRDTVISVFQDIQSRVDAFKAAWASAVAGFQKVVGPDWAAFSESLGKVVTELGAFVTNLIDSGVALKVFKALADAVVIAIDALVKTLKFVADNFEAVKAIIIGSLVAVALPALLAALSGIGVKLGELVVEVWAFANSTAGAMAEASLAGEGLTGVFRALAVSLLGVGAAEDVAFPPMLLIQIAVGVITGLVILLIANFDKLTASVKNLGSSIEVNLIRGFATFERAVSNFLKGLADVLDAASKLIPALKSVADTVRGVSDEFAAGGRAADDYANHLQHLHDIQSKVSGDWQASVGHFGKVTEERKKAQPPGAAPIADVPKAGKSKALQEFLEDVRDKIARSEEALKHYEAVLADVHEKIKNLGKVESLTDLAAANKLHEEAVTAIQRKGRAQEEYYNVVIAQLARVKAAEHNAHSVEDLHKLISEERSLESQRDAAHTKLIAQMREVHDEHQAALNDMKAVTEHVWSDERANWNDRLAAVQMYIDHLRELDPKAVWEINDALQKQTDLLKSAAEEQLKIQEGRQNLDIANLEAQKGATSNKASQYLIDLQIATIKLQEAQENLRQSQENLAKDQKDSEAYSKDYITVQQDQIAVTQAQTAVQNLMLQATVQTRDTLISFAQRVGGPLTDVIEGLINNYEKLGLGTNNLVSAFIQLFEKSLAYKDIEVAVMEITQTLGQVLNVLRPVIDFLIGVIIGVINVFISIYDVIASLLNVLGLNIQKIKLLTSNLQDLNTQVVPLIQITHDLPTINEYNAGSWADLIAKQDAANNSLNNLNNDILHGFDATASKLGEIIGILIAVKVILGIIAGHSLTQQFSGGIFGSILKLFGIGGGGGSTPIDWTGSGAGPGSVGLPGGDAVQVPLPDAFSTGIDSSNTAANIQNIADNTEQAASAAQDTATATQQAAQGTGLPGGMGATGSATELLGRVVEGVGGLIGIYEGFKTGGPLGGLEAGFGAEGLMAAIAPAFAAGPIGIGIAAGVGLLSMLFGGKFGPNPANEPDIYAEPGYGQSQANLMGLGVGQFANMPMNAGGQQYSMNPQIAAETGGLGILQFIAKFQDTMGGAFEQVLGPLAQVFEGLSQKSTDIISGKNGIMDLINGVQISWQQLAQDGGTALQKILAYMQQVQSGTGLLANAMQINLAQVYGNGRSVGVNTGGGGGNAGPTGSPNMQISVTIGNVNGDMTSDDFQQALQPVFDKFMADYALQQKLFSRTNNYYYGRGL